MDENDFPHLAQDSEENSVHGGSPWNGYVPTPRPWRDMYTCPDRLFPRVTYTSSASSSAEGGGGGGRLLQMLDDFPELLSAWTGLLLRNLDFASIVRVSRSCRQLRHLGQDPATWKLLSYLTWGPCTRADLALFGGSWKSMFISRPRPRTDGVYILKWSTVKYGTNEGMGTKEVGKDFFRPCSILCMLRILIFRHGQKVAMITTNTNAIAPENLGKALRKLLASSMKKRSTRSASDGLGLVCLGDYAMSNNEIDSKWRYTPPQFPGMRKVCVRIKQSISSTIPGSNDQLHTLLHTTGSEDDGTLSALPLDSKRPFHFVPLSADFTAKMMCVEGWPECNVEGTVHCEYREPRMRTTNPAPSATPAAGGGIRAGDAQSSGVLSCS